MHFPFIVFFFLSGLNGKNESHTGPTINARLSPNVTGVLGKEVRLSCHVEHLDNKTVSLDYF